MRNSLSIPLQVHPILTYYLLYSETKACETDSLAPNSLFILQNWEVFYIDLSASIVIQILFHPFINNFRSSDLDREDPD